MSEQYLIKYDYELGKNEVKLENDKNEVVNIIKYCRFCLKATNISIWLIDFDNLTIKLIAKE